MIDKIKTVFEKIHEKYPGIIFDYSEKLFKKDFRGDIIIDAFFVPENEDDDFLEFEFNVTKEILWPADIYNVLIIPHTVSETEKYYPEIIKTGYNSEKIEVQFLDPYFVLQKSIDRSLKKDDDNSAENRYALAA